MRLKEDDESWKAGGIKRRDFRHDPSAVSEINNRHNRKAKRKPRKKIDHKHVWAQEDPVVTDRTLRNWYITVQGWDPWRYEQAPKRWHTLTCSICRKTKHKRNMRFGYEWFKWRKLD